MHMQVSKFSTRQEHTASQQNTTCWGDTHTSDTVGGYG